jgi:hypothetical protein
LQISVLDSLVILKNRFPAIEQKVCHLLPNPADRFRPQVRACEIYGKRNSSGTGFLLALLFPLPILIPPAAPYSPVMLPLTLYSPNTKNVVKKQTLKQNSGMVGTARGIRNHKSKLKTII